MLIYFDQKDLIDVFDAGPDAHMHRSLRALASGGQASIVISEFHIYEIRRDGDRQRRLDFAQFLDSLNPKALRTSREIHQEEVRCAFFSFLGVPYQAEAMLFTSLSDLSRFKKYRAFGLPKAEVTVTAWMHHLDANPEEVAIVKNQQVIFSGFYSKLRDAVASDKSGAETLLQEGVHTYVKHLLPLNTPANVMIDEAARDAFLKQFRTETCASLDLTVNLFRLMHSNPVTRVRDTQIVDLQHVTMLPHVDLLTTDARMREYLRQVLPSSEVSKLCTNVKEVLARFPSRS